MLSLPDYREKQILFIESYEVKELSFLNQNLTLKQDGKIKQQVPFHKIFAIFVVGNCTLSSVFIKRCHQYGVMLILTEKTLAVYAQIGGETEGNFLLREKQYQARYAFKAAQTIVANKIYNQHQLIKKVRPQTADLKQACAQIKTGLKKVAESQDEASLRGLEGNAAKVFFSAYFKDLNWQGRKPRTKYDEINVLLDIGYTFLFYFIDAHLRLYGFDRYKGVYHTEFYQRQSLTCDLVEPFRCLIDQAILKAFNLKQFDREDFEIKKQQYHLKKDAILKYNKLFLQAIMSEKEAIFVYIQQFYRNQMKNESHFPEFKR
ncbi:type V CRISPR-associated endonuclease Cas1 [bacterium]|nr:type V CRISPR-associated endonuclease Cas1 [bacterium]NCQ55367.1 type V CRISPR-associated endonuclease Cas1 [Candidatus Parcubacteria bacterium]NCS96746.1 type V CRISPR-associated endonuclease Cas1 [bacterium]